MGLASQAGIFRGARFSSLPTNACSMENNIPFPLFYLRGKWPINSCAIKCWRAKRDFNVTLELPFSLFLSFAKAMQCMEYSKILTKSYFATLNLTFIRGPQSFASVRCRSSNYQITLRSRPIFQNLEFQCDWLSMRKECCLRLSMCLWVGSNSPKSARVGG